MAPHLSVCCCCCCCCCASCFCVSSWIVLVGAGPKKRRSSLYSLFLGSVTAFGGDISGSSKGAPIYFLALCQKYKLAFALIRHHK